MGRQEKRGGRDFYLLEQKKKKNDHCRHPHEMKETSRIYAKEKRGRPNCFSHHAAGKESILHVYPRKKGKKKEKEGSGAKGACAKNSKNEGRNNHGDFTSLK